MAYQGLSASVGTLLDCVFIAAHSRVADKGLRQMESTTFDTATTGATVSHSDEDIIRESSPSGAPRYSRRLSDKILIAFHHACDQGDFEVAEQLLHILEMMLTRRPLTPDGTRRRNMESLVAAHERLWHLRHPNAGEM
jgi:hypothetical protein